VIPNEKQWQKRNEAMAMAQANKTKSKTNEESN